MITKFITEVRARFNPFARPARTCRIFVAQFGPAVWPTVRFKNELLPRASAEPSSLKIKFRTSPPLHQKRPLSHVAWGGHGQWRVC